MSSTHTITLTVTLCMEDMTGTAEQSAEIAFEQLSALISGEDCQYGRPTDDADVVVTGYSGEDGEDVFWPPHGEDQRMIDYMERDR